MAAIKDNIDISTKNGRLLLTMLSAIADYERETIMERMEAGKERAKLEGTKTLNILFKHNLDINFM